MMETKKAPANSARRPACALAATKCNKVIIAQTTIKTKRRGYRVTIQKTAFNQFIIMLLFIVGVLLTYMLLAYIFGVPGDAALRIGG